MENSNIEIKFDLEKITNNFLLHLQEITKNVSIIYHSIENSKENIHKPLPTESLPILIFDENEQVLSIREQKEKVFSWVVIKAFEEMINGLTKSLKEAYKYLSIFNLSINPNPIISKEKLEIELKKINVKSEKIHFPDLIKRIESILKINLPLKEEILSINKIRNCLVHRDGIVGEKDIKSSKENTLLLKWNSLKIMVKVNGKLIEMTYELRKNKITADSVSSQIAINTKRFELNSRISIDINEFNGIAYTCTTFANQLLPLMPRPKIENQESA